MKLILAAISAVRSRAKSAPAEQLATFYTGRAAGFLPVTSEVFATEAALLAAFDPARQQSRTRPVLILFDRLGQALSSEQFAARLGNLRDSGSQAVVLAIGPADGWSAEARARANLLISFGPITLPHELARVVLAEQLYRALTILAGHPYHSGH